MQAVKVLFGFLLPFLMLNGIESVCDYFQNLEAGQTYYVYNPGFPYKYKGANQCTWQMTSRYVTKINCSVDIPAFVNGCIQDSLSIQFTGGNIQKYCGFGTLVLEGTNPIIKLYSPYSSQGGQFLCQIQAENPFDENNCKCGWKKVTRIVGGTETGVNEYPMMSGLVDIDIGDIYCGCTIISQQYVLTAAHCIERRDITRIGILVGEHDVTTGNETKATKLFRVNKCIMHPYYKETRQDYDIAICKIIGALKYSAEVGPVCLPFQHKRDTFVGVIVDVLGWGLLEFAGAKSTTLQKVKLNVISPTKCKDYYPELTNSSICTYSRGKDSCQMDSGGPLLWQNPTTHNLVLVGIVSTGIGCGSNEPAVATRTGAFIDWIMSVTPDVQYCKVE
ncbi:venom serine protease 34 isoform X1 [Camponotus floridanus]|uniref:venom serine protease 34 isoform X1 n=2 Tax=Camponotus floridanus TaxID=104421 RepID=UPI000DC6B393|nr:venom serine protease 34 isoform X1 [Camponotus floridanus]